MKKKMVTICLVVALVLTAVAGGTLAYFTDEDSAKNVMKTGNVDIVQNEKDKAGADFVQNQELFPMVDNRGANDPVVENGFFNEKMANVIDKVVTVTNTGSKDAYVRTILAFETATEYAAGTDTVLRDGKTIFDTYIGTLGSFELVDTDTITIDGVEYVLAVKTYADPLAPEATSTPSLKQFFLSPDANNEVVTLFGSEYNILALSQAVQVEGFADADAALNTAFGEVNATNAAEWFK